MEEGTKVAMKEGIVETMKVVTLEEVILLHHTPLQDLLTQLRIIVDLIIKSALTENMEKCHPIRSFVDWMSFLSFYLILNCWKKCLQIKSIFKHLVSIKRFEFKSSEYLAKKYMIKESVTIKLK